LSCARIICNSTKPLDAASPSVPVLIQSWTIPLAWLARMAQAWGRQCQYKQLLELDDRLLADIGISRTAVQEARGSPLYLIAWRDSR
jgi:uncharacterized protein YjiS (DUF1127 family)